MPCDVLAFPYFWVFKEEQSFDRFLHPVFFCVMDSWHKIWQPDPMQDWPAPQLNMFNTVQGPLSFSVLMCNTLISLWYLFVALELSCSCWCEVSLAVLLQTCPYMGITWGILQSQAADNTQTCLRSALLSETRGATQRIVPQNILDPQTISWLWWCVVMNARLAHIWLSFTIHW